MSFIRSIKCFFIYPNYLSTVRVVIIFLYCLICEGDLIFSLDPL